MVLENFPVDAVVTKAGGQELNKMSLSIMNLSLEKMEQLTFLGFRPLQSFNNVVTLHAGEFEDYHLVFIGEITSAFADFQSDSIVSFKVEAIEGIYPLKMATPATSVQGSVQIDQLMAKFAGEAGYGFENNGVSGSVSNSIFNGDPITKAKRLERQTGIKLIIDNNKFIIQPRGEARSGTTPYLSKENGLLGYPRFNNDGIDLNALYDKNFQLEGLITVDSIVPKASGIWRITKLVHNLQAGHSSARDWTSSISAIWVQE